jgi:hypothetical protein
MVPYEEMLFFGLEFAAMRDIGAAPGLTFDARFGERDDKKGR